MSGGIAVATYDPIYVDHDGSTAVLYYLEDTEDVRGAAREMIDLWAKDADGPIVVIVDHRSASIFVFPKVKVA